MGDLFTKKTMRGYPKSEENLTPNDEGYHIFGQNIKYQYPQKVLLSNKYLHIVDPNKPILAYTSSVGEIGMISESFYRSGDNGAFQGLFPKFNNYNYKHLLFILNSIMKQFRSFNYGTSMNYVLDILVKLPIKNNEIDFDFMESFIAELEAQRVAELEAQRVAELHAYLKVTGLSSYELTTAETEAIQRFDNMKWKEIKVSNLLGNASRGKRLKSADRIKGNLPFVTAGENNQGISDYVGNDIKIYPSNTITIDMFGSAKYRNYNYGADDHVSIIISNHLNKLANLFITGAIHKSSYNGQFNYGKNFYPKDADTLNIKLPINENNEIDFKYMETCISAVQKLVIKDVVDYADKKIKTTKQIIK